ncbi:putative ethanolamine kinase [Cladophialophora carrionii]|uniref:ethanolamine kinase n=1 Tax=Cladophialophora carrionii TaxID=86049 RepID=A0A1C1CSS0_9EURO|nr:putative ethanolamine kinase [Cladophialophora carrionii]
MGTSTNSSNGHVSPLQNIDLAFDNNSLEDSARSLAYRVQPKWRDAPGDIVITKFTDGITNTLLKISKHTPGLSESEIDGDSVLLRAYGNHTEIIIDRDREARSHGLCAELGLAPPLLARFRNGLLYKFIIGQVCTPPDLVSEPVWRAVARRLGEWHARLPIAAVVEEKKEVKNGVNGHRLNGNEPACSELASRQPVPNMWSVMQKWVHALPCDSPKQEARKQLLQKELDRSFKDLDNERGPGSSGFVFGHCDLLSANVIMLPKDHVCSAEGDSLQVSFIDYEYATPCPAAFDIANHFAEWGGYDCDYNMLPTKSVRRQFLKDYLDSFAAHSDRPLPDDMLDTLYQEVDRYRGMPGFYWGVWALIQATISQIDFDYASYAEVRLGEYYAWRAEENGSRMQNNLQMPLRERRWATE